MSGYDGIAISSFDFHHSMLADELRTTSFLSAIDASVRPGDIVVDIGTGTGVLSVFAAKAGASRVYAIEQEPIIGVAREIAARNGLSDIITFIQGSSLEIDLPEKADVLITETIGNMALDEGIITWITDARERFLKPGGTTIPLDIDVIANLVCVPIDYEMIERWSQPMLGLDFAPLSRVARNNIHWVDLSRAQFVTRPVTVFSTDFPPNPAPMSSIRTVDAIKDVNVHGIGVWFRSSLTADIHITNEAPNGVPSWEHGFLPLDEPMAVRRGQAIEIEIGSSINGADWNWRVGSEPMHSTLDGRLSASDKMGNARTSQT
jgi:protein arginine N-methyltransferase 1